MPQKRQSPGKRANAARANYRRTHGPQPSTTTRAFAPVGAHHSLASECSDNNQQPAKALPSPVQQTYSPPVTVNPVIDLGRSNNSRRTGAPTTIAGAFFAPAVSCYGSCARDTFGCAGRLESRSANPRTAVTLIRLAANGGSSSTLGTPPCCVSTLSIRPHASSAHLHTGPWPSLHSAQTPVFPPVSPATTTTCISPASLPPSRLPRRCVMTSHHSSHRPDSRPLVSSHLLAREVSHV
ncbi:hypothetical protein D9M70_435740 [compost metagenome]